MYDFHLHSNFSMDSTATMEDMVVSGIKRNLKGICFTDHIDLDRDIKKIDMDPIPKDYFITINNLKHKYRKDIEIYAGIELGIQAELSNIYTDFVQNNPLDFVIMSIHSIDGKDIYLDDFVNTVSPKEALKKYYDTMYNCVRDFNDYDTLGHIDFIDRYFEDFSAIPKYEEYSLMIDNILKILIDKGKGLEVNTAGLKYGLDCFHPKIQILNRYKDLGGEIITFGSDSHSPNYIAYKFLKTKEVLKEIGFNYISIFKERKIIDIKIK